MFSFSPEINRIITCFLVFELVYYTIMRECEHRECL
jgi:hypothetical protein